MRLPAFDYSKMAWDAWNAFHVVHKNYSFIQFDTGEFVVCRSNWRPESRCLYKELGIEIVATGDAGCPPLFMPGDKKPIPKSHLNHGGMQTLLLDLTHKRAVGLGSWVDLPSVPARFTGDRRINVYYAGPNALPIGAPIVRHYPQPLTTTQRAHINEITDACKVWLQMQPDPGALKLAHRKVTVPVRAFTDVSFSVLTSAHRTAIAERGVDMIVKETYHWLTFNVEEGETNYDD